MSSLHEQRAVTLDLSREEQWAVHHALLDRMEREAREPADADPPPLDAFRVFEKLEAGTHRFSNAELGCLVELLSRYEDAPETPDYDRPIVGCVLDRLPEPSDAKPDA